MRPPVVLLWAEPLTARLEELMRKGEPIHGDHLNSCQSCKELTTATITTILLKKGIRNTWMRGTMPFADDQERVAGEAFTLAFCADARGSGEAGELDQSDFYATCD